MNNRGFSPISSCIFTPNLIKIQWAVWTLQLSTDGRTDGRTDTWQTSVTYPKCSQFGTGNTKKAIFRWLVLQKVPTYRLLNKAFEALLTELWEEYSDKSPPAGIRGVMLTWRSISPSISQWVSQWVCQWVSQWVSQLINQSINQSMGLSNNQSIK